MKCNKCNTENRPNALFCKRCGEALALASANPLAGIIGMEKIKGQMNDLSEIVRSLKSRGTTGINIGLNFLIMGASGTGKTFLAQAICKMLFAVGAVQKPTVKTVDAVEWLDFIDDWQKNIASLKGGILVVDNVQKLVPNDYATDVNNLDILLSGMQKWGGSPAVILCGLPGGFREYIDKNPSVRQRFNYFFHLEDYGAKDLTAICMDRLINQFKLKVPGEVTEKIERVFMHLIRNKPEDWGNAHSALKMADEIFFQIARRPGADTVTCNDVVGQEFVEKSQEQILGELDKFVGIDNIRQEVQALINSINFDKQRTGGLSQPEIKDHYVFSGNPGTGKTTIARVFADILKALGVLPIGQLIEADRSKLVSSYVGETAIQTNQLVDSAMGGILFIDEAYTLAQGDNDNFGQEAIDTLLKRLEDDRGKFVCIVAGYTKEMFNFISSNPGLTSRFTKTIEFKDYNGDALTEMFRRMVRGKNFTLTPEADANLKNFFDMMFISRTKNFGNAREVRKTFEAAKSRQSKRLQALMAQGTQLTQEMLTTLTREDVEGKEASQPLSVDDVMNKMEKEFVGMGSVKKAIRELAQQMLISRRMMEMGVGNAETICLNIVLTGNPGTGKTSVARTLGDVLKAVHILPTNKVIEADKSKLVGQHVGDTPKIVSEICDRAMGGILFVDEAYTLTQDNRHGDIYGREAVETLMKRMEDDRGKFVVICAGYRDEMEGFLEVNPGMRSRMTHYLHIEDYTADELSTIFLNMIKGKGRTLTPEAEAKLRLGVNMLVEHKDKNFGNAREMRKLMDEVVRRQSARLYTLMNAISDPTVFTTIEADDIPEIQ